MSNESRDLRRVAGVPGAEANKIEQWRGAITRTNEFARDYCAVITIADPVIWLGTISL